MRFAVPYAVDFFRDVLPIDLIIDLFAGAHATQQRSLTL
jgi:hypothetical protein